MSIELYNNSENSVYANGGYLNLYDCNYNSLDDSKIKQLVDLMKKKCLSLEPKASALT